jgi:hypothetical protein
MNATTGISGRMFTTMMRLAGALALALLLMGAIAHGASATDMDKGAFKTGCESGGHSYVDNADGSFQCNLKDGGTIKCQNTSSPCTYAAKLILVSGTVVVTNGNLQIQPSATPVVTRAHIGAIAKVGAKTATAP